jgi:tetratricopeptide (TPR) repeat protein
MLTARFFFYAALVAVLAILQGCVSARKAYDQGNYEESVTRSVERLRSSPDNRSAREVLAKAYPMAISWHKNRIAQMQSSSTPFRWEEIAASYEAMNRLSADVARCPACLQIVKNEPLHTDDLQAARERAAEARYQAGMSVLINPDDKRQAREALQHFSRAEALFPNYKDVRQKIDESRYYATWKVVVEQIPVHSRAYQLSNEFFQNQISQFLISNRRLNEFVRFYTPEEAMTERLENPDHIIRLQFDDFVVGQTFVNSNTETVTSKDSVVVGQVTIEGRKVDVYNKVSAKVTVFRKVVNSRGLLDMQIYDARLNRVVHQRKMPGEFNWFSEWGSFNGDERALNADQRRITRQREVPPPDPQTLFVEFCRPIYNQVTEEIRRFYRNF